MNFGILFASIINSRIIIGKRKYPNRNTIKNTTKNTILTAEVLLMDKDNILIFLTIFINGSIRIDKNIEIIITIIRSLK
ncbi:MAG: hypothetical protein ORN26_02210 [Candidatus Pacebacteria bacterium]|nr:hypothetical protein [Candidatus Paceibacterota bacterium]